MAKIIKIEYNSWNGINQNPGQVLVNALKVESTNPQDDGTTIITYNNAGYDPQNPVDTFIASTFQTQSEVRELQTYTINVYKQDGLPTYQVVQERVINTEQIIRITSYGSGSLVVYQEFSQNTSNFITAYCNETFNSFSTEQQNNGIPNLPMPVVINSYLATDGSGNLVWVARSPIISGDWNVYENTDGDLEFDYQGGLVQKITKP